MTTPDYAALIEDAERRIGSYIASGGSNLDQYVKRQVEKIERWTEQMVEIEMPTFKPTGIIRRIDDLGRIVIPKNIRKTMDITEGDPLEISTLGDCVLFRKYTEIGRR